MKKTAKALALIAVFFIPSLSQAAILQQNNFAPNLNTAGGNAASIYGIGGASDLFSRAAGGTIISTGSFVVNQIDMAVVKANGTVTDEYYLEVYHTSATSSLGTLIATSDNTAEPAITTGSGGMCEAVANVLDESCWVAFEFSPSITFIEGDAYHFLVWRTGSYDNGNYVAIRGNNTQNNSAGRTSMTDTFWYEGSNFPYYRMWEGEPPWYVFASTTQIAPPYLPGVGVVEPDQTVTFAYDYFVNDLQTPPPIYAGFQVENQTQGISYNTLPGEQLVVASGLSSFSQDLTLPIGDAFRWRPYLRYATSTFIYGYWSPFSVVEQNAAASPFTPVPGGISTSTQASFCDAYAPYDNSSIITATLTYLPNGLCRVVGFLLIPSDASLSAFTNIATVAETKAPISWAFEVRGVYESFVATTTESFPALSLNLGTTSNFLGGGPIELLSEEKVEEFAGSTALSLFRALLATVFWLSALAFVYRQISGIWHKQVT